MKTLSPQLYDRLSRGTRASSVREAVSRDIAVLANCAARGARLFADADAEVAGSVLNYGAPPLSASVGVSVDGGAVAVRLRDIVRRFEPRVIAESVRVEAGDRASGRGAHAMVFDIRAVLKESGEVLAMRLVHEPMDAIFHLESA